MNREEILVSWLFIQTKERKDLRKGKKKGERKERKDPPWNESTVNTVFFHVNPSPPFDDFLRNSSSIQSLCASYGVITLYFFCFLYKISIMASTAFASATFYCYFYYFGFERARAGAETREEIGRGAKREQFVSKDRKSTRLNSSHSGESRMPSSA